MSTSTISRRFLLGCFGALFCFALACSDDTRHDGTPKTDAEDTQTDANNPTPDGGLRDADTNPSDADFGEPDTN